MLALFSFTTILYALLRLLAVFLWSLAVLCTTTTSQLPALHMFVLKALYPDSSEEHACRD